MMHSDLRPYFHFTRKSRLDQSINSLLGLLEGVAMDGLINEKEMALTRLWLVDHADVTQRHPFSELIPALETAVADGVLDPEELEDLRWLCQRLQSTEFYDRVTADIQRLHAVLGGIAADGVVSVEELEGLSDWLADHDHLKTCWPYDEIEALVLHVLKDKIISPEEQTMLLDFFREFMSVLDDRTITEPLILDSEGARIGALCAIDPEISFEDSTFCFTGASARFTRKELADLVQQRGGSELPRVTSKLNYLVIGADGNPCWAYARYGRKVEQAVTLRKKGVRLVIVHERDFHDALA